MTLLRFYLIGSIILLNLLACSCVLLADDSSKEDLKTTGFKATWDALGGDVSSGRAEIDGRQVAYTFDLGSRTVGKAARVKLVLENILDVPLRLSSKGSCGCTVGFPTELVLQPRLPVEVFAVVTFPDSPKSFESNIVCFDRNLELEFSIRLKGTAILDFVVEPAVVFLDSRNDSVKEFTITTTDSVSTLGEVSIESDGIEIIEQTAVSDKSK